ncbi:ankyrin repeat domain 53 [Brachyhypopomus gauderio]|uniref:ankyrin repeat domain 53 n=1 Tax=Brachyhypopomus gauderio TaxID=698409 RepID=UPI004040EFCA
MARVCLPGRKGSGVGGRVPTAPPDSDMFHAAVSGQVEWLRLSLNRARTQTNKQGLTVLHVAAQYGRLECARLLVESGYVHVNAACPRGRRPVHMALSPQSRPQSHACLAYLLEHGAEPDVSTDEGLTPLHMAAAEGLRKCVKTLVKAGANTHACDSTGHTPLDLARLWGHRSIARFLRNAMWHRDKKNEIERCRKLQDLRQTLIEMDRRTKFEEKVVREALVEEKLCEWAVKKGLPQLWAPPRASWALHPAQHTSPEPAKIKRANTKKHYSGAPRDAWNISPNPSRPPPASIGRPQQVRMGVHPEKAEAEPDLRRSVRLHRSVDGRVHYTTSWDCVPQPTPALPLDVLQRGLFPLAFPSRIGSPVGFQCSSVLDLPHRGREAGVCSTPWTEVAMHLAEELRSGHY